MEKVTLQPLPYDYNALSPYISEETLRIHHDRHHQAYCDNYNKACEALGINPQEIISHFKEVSKLSLGVRNHGGGFWNHQFYWESLAPQGTTKIDSEIKAKIEKSFGSFEEFKNQFAQSAATLFGSGWTWLGLKQDGSLIIHNTQNQDNTYMDVVEEKYTPLLVIDVWEHAYYIDYQNKRPDYIENFFNIINWDKVYERYKNAK
jgi:Fe-Mn family superoxide dismutase